MTLNTLRQKGWGSQSYFLNRSVFVETVKPYTALDSAHFGLSRDLPAALCSFASAYDRFDPVGYLLSLDALKRIHVNLSTIDYADFPVLPFFLSALLQSLNSNPQQWTPTYTAIAIEFLSDCKCPPAFLAPFASHVASSMSDLDTRTLSTLCAVVDRMDTTELKFLRETAAHVLIDHVRYVGNMARAEAEEAAAVVAAAVAAASHRQSAQLESTASSSPVNASSDTLSLLDDEPRKKATPRPARPFSVRQSPAASPASNTLSSDAILATAASVDVNARVERSIAIFLRPVATSAFVHHLVAALTTLPGGTYDDLSASDIAALLSDLVPSCRTLDHAVLCDAISPLVSRLAQAYHTLTPLRVISLMKLMKEFGLLALPAARGLFDDPEWLLRDLTSLTVEALGQLAAAASIVGPPTDPKLELIIVRAIDASLPLLAHAPLHHIALLAPIASSPFMTSKHRALQTSFFSTLDMGIRPDRVKAAMPRDIIAIAQAFDSVGNMGARFLAVTCTVVATMSSTLSATELHVLINLLCNSRVEYDRAGLQAFMGRCSLRCEVILSDFTRDQFERVAACYHDANIPFGPTLAEWERAQRAPTITSTEGAQSVYHGRSRVQSVLDAHAAHVAEEAAENERAPSGSR